MENRSPLFYFLLIFYVHALDVPGSCRNGEYYEPALLACQACPVNVSMVPSMDGFSCSCEENSIPISVSRCRRCNTTEVLSSDRRSCVPRRCQSAGGRTVCRRCPADYITVTQNFDGSPMKEIICVKCARGFKAENNACVRCESCACSKQEAIVRGRCIPNKFMKERPKYEETKMHPYELLDAVRDEYFCMQNDNRSCMALADRCVKSFYSTDLAGPCRLWIQPRITQPIGLPTLTIESSNEKNADEITLTKGMHDIIIALVTYTSTGGVRIEKEAVSNQPCFLPLEVKIGVDFLQECKLNISAMDRYIEENIAPFLYIDNELRPIPVTIRRPDGTTVQRGTWPSGRFRRYFIINQLLSTTHNTTSTVYLQTILIRIQIQRDKSKHNALKLAVSMEVKYATKSISSKSVTMTISVENEMPGAGIIKGLEIWGGVLCAFLSLYGVVQWRGGIRRGGVHYSLIPLLAGSVSDALYFAVLLSTLYALAADADTLKMTLPLSRYEEHMIRAFVYSAIVLKMLKVTWMNWNQCRCDILFIDWSEYNPPIEKETLKLKIIEDWKKATLAREWCRLQTTRRCSPGYTACFTIIIMHLPFISSLWQTPQNQGYKWALISFFWWCSYTALITTRWVKDRLFGSPTDLLPKLCKALGLSLWVFQEEYYAHYVHGRNDDDVDGRSVTPLASCRVVCVPQLRMVYKQLSMPGLATGPGEADSKQALLSRFFAAFIERALDGLSWVANERTIIERLLDVELLDRENGITSVLLYDNNEKTPSCFSLTWWGQEWSLGTFDAMLFGVIFMATGDSSWALLGTVAVWQIMTNIRSSLAIMNQKEKSDLLKQSA